MGNHRPHGRATCHPTADQRLAAALFHRIGHKAIGFAARESERESWGLPSALNWGRIAREVRLLAASER